MTFLLDSNIFIARFDPTDVHHKRCKALVDRALAGKFDVVAPSLVLTEIAVGLNRRTKNPEFARDTYRKLWSHPNMRWLDVTVERAIDAAEFGIAASIRGGADAIIAYVAKSEGIPLVTLDQLLRDQIGDQLVTLSPEEFPNSTIEQ